MAHQLCCDVMFAFQENHKMAAQNLLKLYVGEALQASHQETIVNSIMTYVLNFHDNESHYSL